MKIACFHNLLIEPRGAELAFKNIAVGLAKKAHTIDVYAFDSSKEFENEFTAQKIKFFSYRFRKERAKAPKGKIHASITFIKYKFKYLAVIKKISKKINREDYDVALVSHWHSAMIIPTLRKPVLYYCQEPPRHVYEYDPGGFGDFISAKDKSKLTEIVEKKVLDRILDSITKYVDLWCGRQANIIVANSEYSREILQKIYKKPVVKVYLGVDTEIFRENNQIKRRNVMLSIGPLRFFKGHDLVIKALGLLPADKRPTLIIVGDGDARNKQYLLELSNKLNVNIDIKSNISTDELVVLYNTAFATICAFTREPFGLVAIESMACGTPVIAFAEGGLVETVNKERGILVKREPRDLAEAICFLESNPALVEELGKNGSAFVRRNFTWEACCENLERILSGLAGKP